MNSTNTSVRALAYIGVAVEDPQAWLRFGCDVLGFMPAAKQDGEDRLRIDERSWRIAVEKGATNDLAFIGYEVTGEEELEAMFRKLLALGIKVTEGSDELAKDRGVFRLIQCNDPNGLSIEISCGNSERTEYPFVSPCGVNGFVTGAQGLGHVVLGCDDPNAMRRFYVDALGFKLSDRIRMNIGGFGQVEMEFFNCNQRHHTLALVPVSRPRKIFHFMVQVANMDDVGFALDRVQAAGAKITSTLGRHTNDHMFSFYAATPGGIEIEFGCGARTIDHATWREALHYKPSMWGHKRG
jgi:2,3-dihydroxybiphenyl 1,2-dioxygenase